MDETQFIQLVSAHQGIIYKICRLYRNTVQDQEDLFQEIVFQLWKSAPVFQGRSKFSSWMYRIALNTAITAFRKKTPDIQYMPVLPDRPDEPDGDETAEQLWAALKQLNDADKALITLYLEDLSYREIAAITGITENNVGVKLNRVKSKIQQFLKR